MGLSSKKQKTSTNQNTTMTTTPTNPAFVTEGIEGLAGQIKSTFGGMDPSKWTPGANPLQTQAAGMAAGLGRAADPFAEALGITRGVAGAGPNLAGVTTADELSAKDGVAGFLNPYLKDVVGASLADFDFGAGKQRGQAQLDLANDATFGGSGGALFKSALEGELARGRGSLSADLHSSAYDKALQAAIADASMRQQTKLSNAQMLNQGFQFNAGQQDGALDRTLAAGAGLAGIGAAGDANTRANAGLQYDIGSGQRDIEAAQGRSPADMLMAQIAAMSGLPLDLLKGSTSTGTMTGTTKSKSSGAGLSDWLGFFAANANAAASAAGGA